MKLTFIIFCFTTVFFDVKCGLIKNLLGTITDKVHEITDEKIINNVGNVVYNETKTIAEDLDDLLHLRQNNKKKEGTENKKDEEVLNAVTAANTQASTATTTNKSVQSNETNIQDINTKPALEKTTGREKDDVTGTQEESTKLSEDSSESTKLVSIRKDLHHGEGAISPRVARHIQTNNKTKEDLAQQETTITNTFDEVIVIYENSQLTNFNNLSDDRSTDMTYASDGVEVVIMKDYPEGQQMIIDGSCIDINVTTEKKYEKEIGRADFVGGCFNGFATANDGSCQEVLYD